MYNGKFLVATAAVTDPIFAQSVMYIYEHNDKSASGIILNPEKEVGFVGFGELTPFLGNKEMPSSFEDFKKLSAGFSKVPMFMGGPCKTPGMYFLHGYEEFKEESSEEKPEFDLGISFKSEDSEEMDKFPEGQEGLYFGSPITFGKILEAGKLEENQFRFYTGISRWRQGQLEAEVAEGAWKVVDIDPKLLFNKEELDKLAGKSGYWFDYNQRFKPSRN